MAQIKVTVSPTGKPTISTEGFIGDTCLAATASLEDILSGGEGVEIRDINGGVVEQEASY